ncbi:MAG: hypothetical protein HA492_01295 [Candidatus Verstraetearchaeota archaeon]|nr:hypothetical protein [Candidatus Verstraetearchaeota archaeon]
MLKIASTSERLWTGLIFTSLPPGAGVGKVVAGGGLGTGTGVDAEAEAGGGAGGGAANPLGAAPATSGSAPTKAGGAVDGAAFFLLIPRTSLSNGILTNLLTFWAAPAGVLVKVVAEVVAEVIVLVAARVVVGVGV